MGADLAVTCKLCAVGPSLVGLDDQGQTVSWIVVPYYYYQVRTHNHYHWPDTTMVVLFGFSHLDPFTPSALPPFSLEQSTLTRALSNDVVSALLRKSGKFGGRLPNASFFL